MDVSELWAQQVEITNFDLTEDRVKNSSGRIKDMTKLRERTNVQAAIGETNHLISRKAVESHTLLTLEKSRHPLPSSGTCILEGTKIRHFS